MNRVVQQIGQRMSLRKPQAEALEILAEAVDQLPMQLGEDSSQALRNLQAVFPHVKDFERDFPNISFALATGVGKTRLMGAMIAYLASAKQIRDFFIVAPNNTILEKLIREFSQPNDPKYVFRGIGQFTSQPPKIVTNDNFDEGYGVRSSWTSSPELFGEEDVHIYIFNMAMFNARERRMKSPRETIVEGMSYFEYLARIPRLVVFMDEAHRYRASISSRSIEGLNPILGIELTATAQIERGGRSEPFRNIIYGYSLAQALREGYLKEPWVAGRENFRSEEYDEDAIERIKLEDGVRIHETTKIHLQNHCLNTGRSRLKPFILVIAASIAHANHLESIIKDISFFEGRYSDKVRVVTSGITAEEEERTTRDLLEIESIHNPIEIVIHVNMLREGWDVVNLYTIVPLRRANSRTLIEQSLGRGLRLPFGERTGKTAIDRLTIVSHDRFDEIVAEASRPDSLIQKSYTIGCSECPAEGIEPIEAKPKIMTEIEVYGEVSRPVAEKILKILETTGVRDPDKLGKMLAVSLGEPEESIQPLVAKVLKQYEALSIRIPRIQVMPETIHPGRYRDFELDTSHISLMRTSSGIILQGLLDGERESVAAEQRVLLKELPEEYLARRLIDDSSVSETEENSVIALKISQQMIRHLRSYLKTEEEVRQVVSENGAMLADFMLAQMKAHYEPAIEKFTCTVGREFTFLKSVYYSLPKGSIALPYTQTPASKSQISKTLFSGFTKSIYPVVQFDSDSERVFANIMEQDTTVLKWVKTPPKSLFLYYQKDVRYEPDFIVETSDGLFMCEVKSSAEINDKIVLQKQEAAVHWCEAATQHAKEHGAKSWSYVLIPHNEVSLTSTFQYLLNRFSCKVLEDEVYILQAKGLEARGVIRDGRFVVLKGSEVCQEETNSLQSCFRELRNSLRSSAIISDRDGILRFERDYIFGSPSSASSVILGASSNGQIAWKTLQGKTLKEENYGS